MSEESINEQASQDLLSFLSDEDINNVKESLQDPAIGTDNGGGDDLDNILSEAAAAENTATNEQNSENSDDLLDDLLDASDNDEPTSSPDQAPTEEQAESAPTDDNGLDLDDLLGTSAAPENPPPETSPETDTDPLAEIMGQEDTADDDNTSSEEDTSIAAPEPSAQETAPPPEPEPDTSEEEVTPAASSTTESTDGINLDNLGDLDSITEVESADTAPEEAHDIFSGSDDDILGEDVEEKAEPQTETATDSPPLPSSPKTPPETEAPVAPETPPPAESDQAAETQPPSAEPAPSDVDISEEDTLSLDDIPIEETISGPESATAPKPVLSDEERENIRNHIKQLPPHIGSSVRTSLIDNKIPTEDLDEFLALLKKKPSAKKVEKFLTREKISVEPPPFPSKPAKTKPTTSVKAGKAKRTKRAAAGRGPGPLELLLETIGPHVRLAIVFSVATFLLSVLFLMLIVRPQQKRGKLQQILQHIQAGRFQSAETLFSAERENFSVKQHIRVGRAYMDAGRLSSALETFNAADDLADGRRIEPYIALGDYYIQLKQYEKAKTHFNNGLKLEPENDILLSRLGTVKMAQIEQEKAKPSPEPATVNRLYADLFQYFRKALNEHPKNEKIAKRFIDAYFHRGTHADFRAAESVYNTIKQKQDDFHYPSAIVQFSKHTLNRTRNETDEYKRTGLLDKTKIRLNKLKQLIDNDIHEKDRSEEWTVKFDVRMDAYVQMGRMNKQMLLDKRAMTHFNYVIDKSDPNISADIALSGKKIHSHYLADAYNYRGEIFYQRMEQYNSNPTERINFAIKSAQDLQRALKHSRNFPSRYRKINYNLGNIFFYAGSVKRVQELLPHDSSHSSVDLNREALAKARAFYERAEDNLNQHSEAFTNTNRIQLAYNLGYIYLKERKWSQASLILHRYEKYDRNNPNVNLLLGTVLLYLRDYNTAIAHLNVALFEDERAVSAFNRVRPDYTYHRELFSRLGTSCNNLGVAYTRLNDKQQALLYFAKSLNYSKQVDRENPFAVANKEQLLKNDNMSPIIDERIPKYYRYLNDKGTMVPRW